MLHGAAVAEGVEPTSYYWKIAGLIPLVCMSKNTLAIY